jgi:hypothetical protein
MAIRDGKRRVSQFDRSADEFVCVRSTFEE